jgi:hypothetical protein
MKFPSTMELISVHELKTAKWPNSVGVVSAPPSAARTLASGRQAASPRS